MIQDVESETVIGACVEVHRYLGPGLLESVYEECLCHELTIRGVKFARQVVVPLNYKGLLLESSYRLDIVLDSLIVEVKAVDQLVPVHVAQLLTYLRLTNTPTGLLINFKVPALKHGIRRLTLTP